MPVNKHIRTTTYTHEAVKSSKQSSYDAFPSATPVQHSQDLLHNKGNLYNERTRIKLKRSDDDFNEINIIPVLSLRLGFNS